MNALLAKIGAWYSALAPRERLAVALGGFFVRMGLVTEAGELIEVMS